jgi:hypothetical protein
LTFYEIVTPGDRHALSLHFSIFDYYLSRLALGKTQIQSPADFIANANDLYIGKTENAVFPYNFNGVIDEIRIYDKSLSPQLVKQFNNLID